MASYSDYLGLTKGVASIPGTVAQISRIDIKVDFPKIHAARTAAGATTLGIGDVIEIGKLPAGSVVLAASMNVTTKETTGATGTLVLTAASVALNAAATVAATGLIAAKTNVPVVSTAAGTITLTNATAALKEAVLTVSLLVGSVG
jgi:hypothetical protein